MYPAVSLSEPGSPAMPASGLGWTGPDDEDTIFYEHLWLSRFEGYTVYSVLQWPHTWTASRRLYAVSRDAST